MIKLIIFDFDGTIVDTKTIYYSVMNKHLNPLGINKREINKAISMGMNVANTLKKMIPSFFYSWWLKRKIMKDVIKEVSNVKKCKDIGIIRTIRTKKVLISNSYSDFVMPILKHLKIERYFDEVYCADDFKDKEDFIKKYLKVEGILPNRCIYVGDRVADIELSKKVGCYSIIIAGKCAWDAISEIKKNKPDFIIHDFNEIKRILRMFNSE